MKQIGVLALIVLAVGAIGLPNVVGSVTQARIERRVAAINANQTVQVEIESYERGWFASSARLVIGLSPDYLARLDRFEQGGALDLLSRKITVLLDVAQGPVMLQDGVRLGWSSIVARPDQQASDNLHLQQQLGMRELFNWRGEVSYGGDVSFAAEVPGIDYASELSTLSTADWSAEGRISGPRMQVTSHMDSLYYSAGTVSLAFTELASTGDNSWASRNVVLGDFEVVAATGVLANGVYPSGPLLEASGLALSSHMELDPSGARMSGNADYRIASAATQNGMQLTDGLMRVRVDNLDVAAMQEYSDILASMEEVAAPNALIGELAPVVERLLAAEPSLAVEPLRISVDGEDVEVNITVRSDASALPANVDWLDTTMWLELVSVAADAAVSKSLAEILAAQFVSMQFGGGAADEQVMRAQASFLLVALASQGMIVDDGEGYSTALEFSGGALRVNGNPLPLGLP